MSNPIGAGETALRIGATLHELEHLVREGLLRPTQTQPQMLFDPDEVDELAATTDPVSQVRAGAELLSGDFFAGAGGLTEGFRQAGFRSLFANDFEPATEATFSLNFPESRFFLGPIQELSARDIFTALGIAPGSLDVLVGGPPCQGFSINAPVRTHEDPRNHLFHHYVRLVLEGLRPRAIVFENVPGLISMGETVHDVVAAFTHAGYSVKFKLLNAAHYGVPQERWRLFIIGSRTADISFPEPLRYSLARPNFTGGRHHTFSHAVGNSGNLGLFSDLAEPTNVSQAISDLPEISNGGGTELMQYSGNPSTSFQRYARRGAGSDLWNHQTAGLSAINVERFEHIPPGGSWRDIPFELLPAGMKLARRSDHTKRYGRLDPAGLSGTVLTKCDPHWGTFVHYAQTRILSVREAARMQSFPDRFRFAGNLTAQYRQVGNAVPPILARAVALEVRQALEQATQLSAM